MNLTGTDYWTAWILISVSLLGCSSQDSESLAFFESGESVKAAQKGDSKQGQQNAGSERPAHTNRLAREISPYLLLHAHNPVDWYPWGPEAFAKAKREGKLIFLSIGYSSCYWCHVMEREVFSDEKIAKLMNEQFVNIKVDREERPDIDDIYMTALNIYFQLTGSNQGGGWPLSMFLTPGGKPFYGGTYIPPNDDRGRVGFPTVMNNVVDAWKHRREAVTQNADVVTQHVRRVMKPQLTLEPAQVDRGLVTDTGQALLATYDPVYGGIDFHSDNPNRPKFPVPTKLALLQSMIVRDADKQVEKVVYHTLDSIAAGGIRDHLAGGFHRYSTDRAWLVPHFEKMLYDNAQLMDVYVEAYRRTNKAQYREVAESIAEFVSNELTDPLGGFYSALDAETDAIEGKYYVWTSEEVEEVLGPRDAEVFQMVFGMQQQRVFEHGYVLHLPKPLQQVAEEQSRQLAEFKASIRSQQLKLLEARNRRERPFRDDKVLASWNGLMIRALANASTVLEREDYRAAAEKAAQFILSSMRDTEGRLLRAYRAKQAKLNAYLDDYAFMIDGLLALFEATGDKKWLDAARQLNDDQIKMFWDQDGNGFFFTSHHHEELLARTKNAYDSVLPSGNSVSVRNLVRLAAASKQNEYHSYARKTLEVFAPKLKQQPRAMANMALALAEFLDSPVKKPAQAEPQQAPSDEVAAPDTQDPAKQKPPQSSRDRSNVPAQNPENDGIIPISGVSTATDKKKKKKNDNAHVSAKAYLSVASLPAGGKCRIVVMLDIQQGWHINTNPAKPDQLIPTTVAFKSKFGTKISSLRYPVGTKLLVAGFKEPAHVYEKQAAIHGTLDIPAQAAGKTEQIEITIRYQPCHDSRCLLPKSIKLTGKLKVAPSGEHVKQINQKLFGNKAKKSE